MSFLSHETLLKTLEWRYAVKAFDPSRKISSHAWDTLEESLRLTPSSYGMQPWKFLIVQQTEVREALRLASWNQKQVTDSSHFVVFTHKETITEADVDHYVRAVASIRGITEQSLAGLRQVILGDIVKGPRSKVIQEWAARQCYIALGNFMTAAALLGVDTCAMEGLDPLQYDRILGLTGTGYRTVMACAAGYRSAEDPFASMKKVRYPKQEVIGYK
jgi:nitroreductase